MNALDKEKDPFEDVFRDKLFDFESEPNDKLWKAIEPQLPANPARRIPYWQMAAVAVLLLLTGVSVYLMPSALSNEDETKTEISAKRLATSPVLFGKDLEKNNSVNNEKPELLDNKSGIIKKHLPTSDEVTLKNVTVTESINKEVNNTRNTRIDYKAITLKEKRNHDNGGSTPPLNPSDNSQNESFNADKQEVISYSNSQKHSFNKKNKTSRSSTFSNNFGNTIDDKSINTNIQVIESAESRFKMLTALNSKDYHPFTNHFRTPRIKYRGPKPTIYFKETKPVEWYLSAMPLINYYTITANGNDANYVHKIAVNDDADRLGFYTQAGLVFTLSDRFKLRTGLTFTKTNHSFSYQVRTDSLVVQSPDNTGVDASFAELKKVYSQSAYYLGTKVELQYIFLRGESLSHYVNVGVEGAYKINGGNQLNTFANIAYGITRQIGDNAYLFVEPTFSYSLNQQSDSNSLLLIKPNKIGFNIGINFKLK